MFAEERDSRPPSILIAVLSHTIPPWAAEWLPPPYGTVAGHGRWAGGGRHCAVPQLAEPDEGDEPFCRAVRAHQRLILRSGTWEPDPELGSQMAPKMAPGTTQGPDPLCGSGP